MKRFLASGVVTLALVTAPAAQAGEIGHRNPTPATSAETLTTGSTTSVEQLTNGNANAAVNSLIFAPAVACYEFITWAGGTFTTK